jgi:hypothetical protein
MRGRAGKRNLCVLCSRRGVGCAALLRCACALTRVAPRCHACSDRALASLPPAQAAGVTLRWRPFLLVSPKDWESWGPEGTSAAAAPTPRRRLTRPRPQR